MKVTTSMTLDLDIAQRLDKEENKSALLSKLLKQHYLLDQLEDKMNDSE